MIKLIDKNKAKNYDLENIKTVFQTNKKEAGKLFSELKVLRELIVRFFWLILEYYNLDSQ